MLDLLALLALSLVGPATQAGSPRVICIQKSHKQRLTMVHLCASQRPHVGLKLFEDCFWVASTSTVVGRIWWQLTSRKGWVNGETIMCSKCCPCPPCALVGWVHDGHVSGSGNIFAFGAGWVGHAMMQIGHWYHQCILNIKQRNITVPLSLTLEWILWRWLTGYLVGGSIYNCCFFGPLDILGGLVCCSSSSFHWKLGSTGNQPRWVRRRQQVPWSQVSYVSLGSNKCGEINW